MTTLGCSQPVELATGDNEGSGAERQESEREGVRERTQDDAGCLFDPAVGRIDCGLAHRWTTKTCGAACFIRLFAHCIWADVSGSHVVTTSRRSVSRAPCAACPINVQSMSPS